MKTDPTEILKTNQVIGDEFQPVSGAHVIILAGYVSGTITLQVKFPIQIAGADVWVDSNVAFKANNALSVVFSDAFKYRMYNSENAGAQAFLGVAQFG